MAKLVIDGINLPVDGLYEHLTNGKLTASKQFIDEEMPDVSGMIGKKSCNSVKYYDEDNVEIALMGTYTVVEDFTVTYNQTFNSYNISLSNE